MTTLNADLEPEDALRQTRERFIRAFDGRHASIRLLIDNIGRSGAEPAGSAGPIDTLHRIVHQMTGLAGTIGLPTVSERALDLEQLITAIPERGPDAPAMLTALDAI